ncbi:uncharacterized protein ARMOST_21911 [Armillaria ostoyae]|uniref:Uncharacterized protein n=1 Tax=Armillaria ostoyae TaxID=47428 RepID=A0A284SBH0_ARMOS|nr:uncharacterized protein ARMOST_21911 [Armillaria ostoyae]
MTPDELTIAIVSAIGGACLLSLLFSLAILANIDRIRRLLRIEETPAPTLPAHYVIPYVQPRPLVESMGQIHTPAPQRQTTYPATSSDDNLPLPPRNATPSPSNVPRTPPPAYNPEEAEEYGRFLRAVFRSPTPDLPLITIPDSPEAPIRALLPEPDNEAPRPPTPSTVNTFHAPSLPAPFSSESPHTSAHSPTRTATPTTSPTRAPTPPTTEETNQSPNERTTTLSTPTDSTMSGPNSRPSIEPTSGPTVLRPENSDGSTSSSEAGSRDLGIESGWDATSPSPEDHQSPDRDEMQTSGPDFTPTIFERSTPPPREIAYITHAPKQTRNSGPSLTSYSPLHWQRVTDPTSTVSPEFDNFNQDQETFGWADEEDEMETALDYGNYQGYTLASLEHGDYRGYTSAPHFYHQPFPLPDSPTYAGMHYDHLQHHPQRIQGYRPPSYGRYPFAGQNSPPRPGGSNDPPVEPPQPSNEERLQQAKEKLELQDRRLAELKRELADQQAERDAHAELHQFDRKGKQPDRPGPVIPNWR